MYQPVSPLSPRGGRAARLSLSCSPAGARAPLLASLLFALALVLSQAGCSDDSEPAANNGASNNPTNNDSTNNGSSNNDSANNDAPTACTDTSDCGVNEVCDSAEGFCKKTCAEDNVCLAAQRCGDEGFCVSRGACTEASACGGDEVCNGCSGRCERTPVQGALSCTVDMNCLFEEFCDTCRNVCRPLAEVCEPCTEDAECGEAADICIDFENGTRACGRACGGDDDCPPGFGCQDVGGSTQCVPQSGNCQSPGECEADDDCDPGMRCGPRLTCVPGCTEGTCPNAQVCDRGSCKPPCATNADCAAPAECDTDGICKIPGGCLTSRDCTDAGTFCNTDTFMCEEGCGDDDDCAGLQICSANTCRPRPCDGNYLCGFGQVCEMASGMCVMAQGPYCDVCDAEAENQCGGDPNMCLRISDEDGNAIGDFCGVGCDPTDLDACPVGYGCEEIVDENMNPVGAVCFRACHRDPI